MHTYIKFSLEILRNCLPAMVDEVVVSVESLVEYTRLECTGWRHEAIHCVGLPR